MLKIIIVAIIIVVMVVSSTIVNDNTNYAMELYTLAYKLHSNVHTTNTSNISNKNVKIHLIRVPKASSTSLSVVARRIVGCTPPGNIISNNT